MTCPTHSLPMQGGICAECLLFLCQHSVSKELSAWMDECRDSAEGERYIELDTHGPINLN